MATIPTDTTFPPTFEPPLQRPEWTVADLLDQLEDIPPERVDLTPTPGTATEKDVLEMNDHGGRLCELIDGTLVEKTMGVYESWLAVRISHFISSFLATHNIGIVTGSDGFLKLFPSQVRAPDVAFIRYERLPGGRVPRDPIPALAPSLAVEVLSPSNTRREMERKLYLYFAAGTELVWYIDPQTQSAMIYTSPDQHTEIGVDAVLSGGEVLPGFDLSMRQLFAEDATAG